MKEGYLFCVGGNILYFKLLQRVIETLRQFDKERPICILSEDIDRAKQFCEGNESYGQLIFKEFQLHNHLHPNVDMELPWHRYGFYPKVFQIMYSPFESTMLFDVDMVFKTDMTEWWDYFKNAETPILVSGVADSLNCSPVNWHWGRIFAVMQASGICIPQVSSSFLIYKKEFKKPFLKYIQYILNNLENWGCLKSFSDGYPDEIIWAIFLGILEIKPDNNLFNWLIDDTKLLCCDKNI